jgi:hypothetical protein
MKKKYVYAKDHNNRITEIYEATPEILEQYAHYYQGEFESSKVDKLQIGLDGLVDGNIQYIGFTKEELSYQEQSLKQQRIIELKQMLQETDWKVVVNAELIQAGLPLKYSNLHEERQAWRDDINDLEAEILFLGLE